MGADAEALALMRGERIFSSWDGFLPPERVEAAEGAIRGLVDEVLGLGLEVREEAVREAVARCVERFNELDDGWICTIEREDICERLRQVVDLCGLDGDADWVDEGRDW